MEFDRLITCACYGYGAAQYETGLRMLSGKRAIRDLREGMLWLGMASLNGHPDAARMQQAWVQYVPDSVVASRSELRFDRNPWHGLPKRTQIVPAQSKEHIGRSKTDGSGASGPKDDESRDQPRWTLSNMPLVRKMNDRYAPALNDPMCVRWEWIEACQQAGTVDPCPMLDSSSSQDSP